MLAEKHGFRNSAYERRENEQYFTQPWCTRALLSVANKHIDGKRVIWEPCAGRGDITMVLEEEGFDVFSSDLDTSNWQLESRLCEQDFLKVTPSKTLASEYSAIITNPPYGGDNIVYDGRKMKIAEAMIRHSINLGVDYIAMLLRTDFNHSSRRRDLFDGFDSIFAYDIVLTSRPRWDWWYDKDPWEKDKGPMHNFKWFVWDRNHSGPPTTYWVGRKDVETTTEEEEDDGE